MEANSFCHGIETNIVSIKTKIIPTPIRSQNVFCTGGTQE